jgi:hypothetical protein
MDQATLTNWFSYNQPTPDQLRKYTNIKAAVLAFAAVKEEKVVVLLTATGPPKCRHKMSGRDVQATHSNEPLDQDLLDELTDEDPLDAHLLDEMDDALADRAANRGFSEEQ